MTYGLEARDKRQRWCPCIPDGNVCQSRQRTRFLPKPRPIGNNRGEANRTEQRRRQSEGQTNGTKAQGSGRITSVNRKQQRRNKQNRAKKEAIRIPDQGDEGPRRREDICKYMHGMKINQECRHHQTGSPVSQLGIYINALVCQSGLSDRFLK